MRGTVRVVPFIVLLVSFAASGEELRYRPASKEAIVTRLGRYAGNDRQREETLLQMFQEAGCDEQHLSELPVRGSKIPNVVCSLLGSSESTIIVGAHFDHSNAGDGVADNWSGASLLPSIYEAIKNELHKHTFVFIGFTDEERGCVGSKFYVNNMTKKEMAQTDAMVNMDTLGLAPTKVWLGHSDQKLTNALVYIAKQLNIPLEGVSLGYVIADSEPFAARNIPGITIHSLTQETADAILHSPRDKPSRIRTDDYYQTYCLLSAYVSFLDIALQPHSNSKSR